MSGRTTRTWFSPFPRELKDEEKRIETRDRAVDKASKISGEIVKLEKLVGPLIRLLENVH
jgi:hypothetical protein